jgi:hypothetical protein
MQARSNAHRRLSSLALADGGFVEKLKFKIFGRPETISEKYERQDRERAVRAPASVPAQAQQQDANSNGKAHTGGINVEALRRREREAGLKNGGFVPRSGVIRGPGTGTSDSIPARMPEGSFVMPADSTEELADVRVSDGEAAVAPELVRRIGAAALLAMRDVTHTPATSHGTWTKHQSGRQRLAEGGVVDDNKPKATLNKASISTSHRSLIA